VRVRSRGDSFYVLLDGSAEAVTLAGHSTSLQAGDWFGELALLDGAPRAATVRATTSVAAARIERSDFLRLVDEEPAIWRGMALGMLALIRDTETA
jgi:CRP-like cAMP-binding protein